MVFKPSREKSRKTEAVFLVGSRESEGKSKSPQALFLLPAFSFGEAKENAGLQSQICRSVSAFEQLPDSYEEAAKLDGAGPVTTLFRILVPLLKATIAVIIMFNVIMQWNSWFSASIYLPKAKNYWPLQLYMREILINNDNAGKLISSADADRASDFVTNLVKYCVTMVGTLPLLCAYPFAQKYFVAGVQMGGVKG